MQGQQLRSCSTQLFIIAIIILIDYIKLYIFECFLAEDLKAEMDIHY